MNLASPPGRGRNFFCLNQYLWPHVLAKRLKDSPMGASARVRTIAWHGLRLGTECANSLSRHSKNKNSSNNGRTLKHKQKYGTQFPFAATIKKRMNQLNHCSPLSKMKLPPPLFVACAKKSRHHCCRLDAALSNQ